MLENGADVGSLDSYDGTGLIMAADRGHVRIVEKPLRTDTDVDHVNNLGWTALLEAVILGEGDARHTEVVRLLVEGGSDPNTPDGEGVTPLGHARANGYDEMAGILEGTRLGALASLVWCASFGGEHGVRERFSANRRILARVNGFICPGVPLGVVYVGLESVLWV